MLVDIHVHLGDSDDQAATEYWKKHHHVPDSVTEPFLRAMEPVDKAVLTGAPWESPGINANECIAQVAQEHPTKLILFPSIDPDSPTALDDIDRAVGEWNAKGFKFSPIYQNFKPDEERYFPIYEKIERMGMPTAWHQGTSFAAPDGPLEWANPVLMDKIARTFPNLKILFAHSGYPWIREVVALLRKRPNIYADLSAQCKRTWVVYNVLVDAIQYNCVEKVFFGTDYTMMTPLEARDGLYQVSTFSEGTNLPAVSRKTIDDLLGRNPLDILGIK